MSETVEIPLTNGGATLIDAADYETVRQYGWYRWKPRDSTTWYAATNTVRDGKKTMFLLHSLLMGFPKDVVDHINRNGLDNRRGNLRNITQRLNSLNRGDNKNNTSGYRGVSLYKPNGKWRATITIDRKQMSLGYYDTPEVASAAYEAALKERLEREFKSVLSNALVA